MSPAKYFKCLNNGDIPIEQCLKQCPNPQGRCLSLPTLKTIGEQRVWRGVASTTQCLNPTRIEYLQIRSDYTIDPFDQAFALLGTRHHQMLEQVAKRIEGLLAEKALNQEVSGILDLLEPIDNGDNYRLIDYKTYGSYAVCKLLGTKNGAYDKMKLALQLNNYRIMAQALNFHVTELYCQATVRDGGTFSAKNNEVYGHIYLLPVEIMPDTLVKKYFSDKSQALIKALESNKLPECCSVEDNWGNRRCKGYCPVFAWCDQGAAINKVELRQVPKG